MPKGADQNKPTTSKKKTVAKKPAAKTIKKTAAKTTGILNCQEASIEQIKHAFANGLPITGFDIFATHPGPHADEIGAYTFATATPEGMHRFPGLINAEVHVYSEKDLHRFKYHGEEGFYRAAKDGILIGGTGRGLFDEHDDRDRKLSCAHIMYRYLGLGKTKEDAMLYQGILNYIDHEDGTGSLARQLKMDSGDADQRKILGILRSFGEIAEFIKKGMKAYATQPGMQAIVFKAASVMFKADIDNQKGFVTGKKQFENAKCTFVEMPNLAKQGSRVPEICVIETLEQHAPYLLGAAIHRLSSDQRHNIAVYVFGSANGHFIVQPSTSWKKQLNMQDTWTMLATKVLKKRNNKVPPTHVFIHQDDIIGAEGLHFHRDAKAIMNGGNSQPDADGICGKELTIEEIVTAVMVGIDPNQYYTPLAATCAKGTCSASTGGGCPMFGYHLPRCIDKAGHK